MPSAFKGFESRVNRWVARLAEPPSSSAKFSPTGAVGPRHAGTVENRVMDLADEYGLLSDSIPVHLESDVIHGRTRDKRRSSTLGMVADSLELATL